MNMKKNDRYHGMRGLAAVALCALCLTSCDPNGVFEGELYKKVIYVLSGDDLIFSVTHDLREPESTGYISVLSGGTCHIDEDVTVELEYDEEALSSYNRVAHDIDTASFARRLSEEFYTISSFSTVLKAGSEDNYATIPVKVRPEGLSPDSVYLIPLRIKSVSNYEVNKDRSTVLYRVQIKNAYADQANTTYYQTRGNDIYYKSNGTDIDKTSTFSLSRIAVPVSANSIRCFVGMNTYEPSALQVAEIERCGMNISVSDDGKLSIVPVGTAQIEMIDDADSNNFVEVDGVQVRTQTFNLHYRYRILKSGADGTGGDADYDIWHEMVETMSRKVALMNI